MYACVALKCAKYTAGDASSGQEVGKSTGHVQRSSTVLECLTLHTFSCYRRHPSHKHKKEESAKERSAHVKHIPQTSSYQPWLDFFLLLSSLCPSWLPTEVFPGAVFLCFTSSVVEAATTQSCLKTHGKKTERRQVETHSPTD